MPLGRRRVLLIQNLANTNQNGLAVWLLHHVIYKDWCSRAHLVYDYDGYLFKVKVLKFLIDEERLSKMPVTCCLFFFLSEI